MRTIKAGPLVVYLLHFDAPVGRKEHYIGSTFERRLSTRMEAHRRGQGALLLRKLIKDGNGFTLVRLWGVLSRSQEHRMKRNGHLKRLCPICSGTLPLEVFTHFPAATPAEPKWAPLAFDSEPLFQSEEQTADDDSDEGLRSGPPEGQ